MCCDQPLIFQLCFVLRELHIMVEPGKAIRGNACKHHRAETRTTSTVCANHNPAEKDRHNTAIPVRMQHMCLPGNVPKAPWPQSPDNQPVAVTCFILPVVCMLRSSTRLAASFLELPRLQRHTVSPDLVVPTLMYMSSPGGSAGQHSKQPSQPV